MTERNTKPRRADASAPSAIRSPSVTEFAEYTASILDGLSKSAVSYGLSTLAHLMDLAQKEARYRMANKDEGK